MSNTTVHFAANLQTLDKLSSTETSTAAKSVAVKPSTPAVAKTDQTSLSVAGGLIAKALAGSDVRTDKVAGLQKAIASGTYNVSSTDVADKLIQALLG